MLTLASVKPIVKLEKRINKAVVKSAVKVIDRVYRDRDYARFYVLETVARVPYFSFCIDSTPLRDIGCVAESRLLGDTLHTDNE
jgi:hypothetical protein